MSWRTMMHQLVFAAVVIGSPHVYGSEDPTSLAKKIEDAYIYAYPLVLMDLTRETMTSLGPGTEQVAINRFFHKRQFPDASFTDVVTPNADTLYSMAWLDLRQEPIVLSVPDTKGRYYVMQMLDAWTNVFAAPGKRTTGTQVGHFAIVGPGWHGALPRGVKLIRAPSHMVWIIGRTQTNGKADYEAVHAIQDQYRLNPLSVFMGLKGTPTVAPQVSAAAKPMAPVEQIAKMDAAAFFSRFAMLLQSNPAAQADRAMQKLLASLGIRAGRVFDAASLDADQLKQGLQNAQATIAAEAQRPSDLTQVNGWQIMYDLGRYGTAYQRRAGVAMKGLGANLPADAIYPLTAVSGDGQSLDGKHRYVLHFPAGKLPPVNAFWSLTMYNDRQFFVDNPLQRYAIGDRDPLRFNEDGSLDIFIQHETPGGDKEANWLPAPSGPFNVVMRLYWPKMVVLQKVWQPEAIVDEGTVQP